MFDRISWVTGLSYLLRVVSVAVGGLKALGNSI